MSSGDNAIHTDVVVVGMGAAGMTAALEAARAGADVWVISKMPRGAPNCTTRAHGDFTYSTDETAGELFAQVVETGGFLNDQRLVEALVEDIPAALARLREVGVEFDEHRQAAPHMPGTVRWSYRGKDAGHGLTEALGRAAMQAGARGAWSQVATGILTEGGRAVGLATLDLDAMRPVVWEANSVVIATGGGAGAYPRHDNPPGAVGDGVVMAYEAGAQLVDIECVSFGFPEQRLPEVFEAPEAPHEPLLALGHAHYFLGGIRIGERGETTLPGLYAAGEATGGVFGAGRLGGSALADTVAFGARAGRAAALAAGETRPCPAPAEQVSQQAHRLELLRRGGADPAEVGERLKALLWRYCGTVKTAATLDAALAGLAEMSEQVGALGASGPDEARAALEAQSIHRLGELVARAARLREESRGCFWRTDHPAPANEVWIRNIVVRRGEDGPLLRMEAPVMTWLTTPTAPRIGAGCFGYVPR